jgi:MFS family permease
MSGMPRWLIPLCLASLLWAFSFGTNAALAPLWMEKAGCDYTLLGLNTSAYYLGIALAAGMVPLLMRCWGHRALVFGMFASGGTAAAFPWGPSVLGWFAWRTLNGGAAALSLIPLETFINQHAAGGRRAQNFGCYAFCIALGMALGTVVGVGAADAAPRMAFVAGGTAALLGGVVVLAWRPRFLAVAEERSGREPLAFRRNFLSFGSAWSQGFLEGGMMALLVVYLKGIGLSKDAIGWLMGGIMVGVIAAQVPVAWVADRLGRTAVLAGCHTATLVGILCLLVPGGTAWLAVWLFAVGACSGAFYPLGLALLGERTPASGLARANAWFLAINCLGSLVGPALTGRAMDTFGRGAMFVVGGLAVGLVLAAWVALEISRRRAGRVAPAANDGDKWEQTGAAA